MSTGQARAGPLLSPSFSSNVSSPGRAPRAAGPMKPWTSLHIFRRKKKSCTGCARAGHAPRFGPPVRPDRRLRGVQGPNHGVGMRNFGGFDPSRHFVERVKIPPCKGEPPDISTLGFLRVPGESSQHERGVGLMQRCARAGARVVARPSLSLPLARLAPRLSHRAGRLRRFGCRPGAAGAWRAHRSCVPWRRAQR